LTSLATPFPYLNPSIGHSIEVERTETTLDEYSTVSEVKEAIIEEFGTSSPMIDVARCESSNRQYNSKGEVLRGEVNSKDIGLFQINERYHLEKSIELGYDIYTTMGNIKYARYLYDHEGIKPWSWSAKCHSPK
jgi:hypothetical protein